MTSMKPGQPLEGIPEDFSEHYGDGHADHYVSKHEVSVKKKLRDQAEKNLCKRALERVGHLKSILDCPAGAGRYWRTLKPFCDELHAIEPNPAMLEAGKTHYSDVTLSSERCQVLADADPALGRYDLVFSSRLLHHFEASERRVAALKKLAELSSSKVLFSIWLTGNLNHHRRAKRYAKHPEQTQTRFFVAKDQLEKELAMVGLRPLRYLHKLRFFSPLVFVLAELIDGQDT